MTKPKESSIEAAVLAANASFYRAFSTGDFSAMDALWARRAPVACFHPATPALIGRELVIESWRQVLGEPPSIVMRCDHARAHVLGETAFVTCYEANGDHPAHLAATNVFILEDDQWRLVHHQAGALAHPIPVPVAGRTLN